MLDTDNAKVQEACYHFLRLTFAGADDEQRELVRDMMLAAAEWMARPERNGRQVFETPNR